MGVVFDAQRDPEPSSYLVGGPATYPAVTLVHGHTKQALDELGTVGPGALEPSMSTRRTAERQVKKKVDPSANLICQENLLTSQCRCL